MIEYMMFYVCWNEKKIIKKLCKIFFFCFFMLSNWAFLITFHSFQCIQQTSYIQSLSRRTSLNTTLGISSIASSFFITANFKLPGLPTLEQATYNCPCVNTWVLSHTPTCFIVWPDVIRLSNGISNVSYTLWFVDGTCKGRLHWKLSTPPFKWELSILRNEDDSRD